MRDRSPSNAGISRSRRPPLWRAIVYSGILTVGTLLLLEGILLLAGVRPVAMDEDPFVGFEASLPLYIPRNDQEPFELITAKNKRKYFNTQTFPRKKPAGTFRIFCLGGSTTYGRPYDDATSFSGWLRSFLNEAVPDRRYEVINAGGISYASYRVVGVLEELCSYEPDLFIVYTGHNEYLEERTYSKLRRESTFLRKIRTGLCWTRLYTAVRKGIHLVADSAPAERSMLGAEVETLLDRSVGPDAYHRDDAWRQQVVDHFRLNLGRMARTIRTAGADLILVTPASSLKDCSPFKSGYDDSLSQEAIDHHRDLTALAWNAALNENLEEASELLAEATSLDGRHAHAHFLLGEALFRLQQVDEAKHHFVVARDEDIVPLRGSTMIIDAVRKVAGENGVRLVDFVNLTEAWMRKKEGHTIPGSELFLDHVHPTREGNRLLAEALYAEMMDAKIIPAHATIDPGLRNRVQTLVEAGIDSSREGLALRNLAKVLSWAGKNRDAARLAKQAIERLGDDAECLFILALEAEDRRDWADAEHSYRSALAMEPEYVKVRHNLATVLSKSGKPAEAIALYLDVLEKDPDHANAPYNLAHAYMRAGKDQQAIETFSQVLRNNPEDEGASFYLGVLKGRSGQKEESLTVFKGLIGRDPDDASVRFEYGKVLEAMGKDEEAVRQFRMALALDPGWDAVQERLNTIEKRQLPETISF